MSRSSQHESIGSALETRLSHIIKYRVTKTVPKRHREGHFCEGHFFCDTDKSYNEEARTSAYEQSKHHE